MMNAVAHQDTDGQTDPEFRVQDNKNEKEASKLSPDADGDVFKEEIECSNDVVFNPPVYIQRYVAVTEALKSILKDTEGDGTYVPKTIFEVGCAEFKMMVYLKNIPTVEKIIFMDIDEGLLQEKKFLLRPLPAECVVKRETPLTIEAYAGSIVKVDQRILEENLFSVIAIEVVEHLHPEILAAFEESVFGIIKAPVVIVTTPNADFNVLFNLPPGKFRHWDHKFEWTRSEFEIWCAKICTRFPTYSYTIKGIAQGPVDLEIDIGCVSQMAIFRKQLGMEDLRITESYTSYIVENEAYKLLTKIEFPFFKDDTPDEERILRELNYFLSCYILCRSCLEYYYDIGQTEIRYPAEDIKNINGMPNTAQDNDFLRAALKNGGYVIEDGSEGNFVIVLQVPKDDDGDGSQSEEERDLPDDDPIPLALSPAPRISELVESDASFYEESWE